MSLIWLPQEGSVCQLHAGGESGGELQAGEKGLKIICGGTGRG